MEDVKKNIITFLEILQVARTGSVTHWDESNFKRARQWARYAEEVHKKLRSKPHLTQLLSSYVNQKQQSNKEIVTPQFNFNDLQCATKELRVILLHNTCLTSSQFSHVLEMYDVDVLVPSKSRLEGLITDTFYLSRNRGIFSALSRIRCELSNSLHQPGKCPGCSEIGHDNFQTSGLCDFTKPKLCSTTDVCLDVCSKLLWKVLQNVLEDAKGDECLILEKLKVIARSEKGMEVILTMLVLPMAGERPATSSSEDILTDPLKCHILHWILESSRNDDRSRKKLWSCPSALLCVVSSMHKEFCENYLIFLKSLAESLLGRSSIPDLDETSYGSSYENLVHRFEELIQGPRHASEFCSKTLSSWCLNPVVSCDVSCETKTCINLWKRIYQQICP